jgi:hypothetical protein
MVNAVAIMRSRTLSAIEDLRIERIARLPRLWLRAVLQSMRRPQRHRDFLVSRRGGTNGRIPA